jgi:hypothetical protein
MMNRFANGCRKNLLRFRIFCDYDYFYITMKELLMAVLFICLLTCFNAAYSQRNTHLDSIKKAARLDAKTFRLNDIVWKKYRRSLPYTSDYFKPQASAVSIPALLNDSAYVDAYRHEAVKQNKKRRTPLHFMVVGAGITAGALILFATVVIIIVAPQMGS